jgi:hypothetical protein
MLRYMLDGPNSLDLVVYKTFAGDLIDWFSVLVNIDLEIRVLVLGVYSLGTAMGEGGSTIQVPYFTGSVQI